jgi:hypothetical protein
MYQQKTSLDKKAQEEMVGFVLIMLVVAVIFLVFLGIYLRSGPPEPRETTEISQFLDAMLEVSTDCTISGSQKDVADLISICAGDESKTCESGDKVCEVARETIIEMTESTWTFSQDSPKTGYKYEFTVETDTEYYEIAVFDTYSKTNQSGDYERVIGSEKNLPGGIHIYLEMRTL